MNTGIILLVGILSVSFLGILSIIIDIICSKEEAHHFTHRNHIPKVIEENFDEEELILNDFDEEKDLA